MSGEGIFAGREAGSASGGKERLLAEDDRGHLAANVAHFGRLLRRAGMPVGPGAVLDAVRAVEAIDVRRKEEFYWALHSVFVRKRDEHELFDEAFKGFWKDPFAMNQALAILLPRSKAPKRKPQARRRVLEAFKRPPTSEEENAKPRDELQVDMALTASKTEKLQTKDFEQMTAEELERAKQAIAKMKLAQLAIPTRRFRASDRGRRIDPRRTLREAMRHGGDDIPLAFRERTTRPPPLVVLCDISGSMGRYSRMLLHFMHALTNDRDRVHSFLFGTRFTNITRNLQHRDIDEALESCGHDVTDWAGGTRIATALKVFNQRWSRRVLGQGAVVLLITDGLDRDDVSELEKEMERLQKSCRRLVWLNPLLRYDEFEPLAGGVKAMLPYADEFRAVHDLRSLAQLAEALGPGWERKARRLGRRTE
ncbi:MAG: VWA domain-containing protein [Myxococcota bacterium]